MRKFFLFFLIALSVSCTNDDTTPDDQYRQYAGNYKIISFKSNIAVDLNNDNVTSKELISEIDNFSTNDLEIRPKIEEDNTKFLSLSFPKTWISFKYPSSPEGYVEFLDYGLGTSYEFENDSFLLEDTGYTEYAYIDNVESNRTVTFNTNLNIIDSTHLELKISKEYYDFSTSDWKMLDIEVVYEKI